MTSQTGGDALVQALHQGGVTDVFGVPGIQLDGAADAMVRAGMPFDFFSLRHEQAASYMADGYGRASGKVGVCMVVPGPGLLNATAGIATGYGCSSPMLVISGQIPSDAIGRGLGMLHEIPDQSGVLAGLTKASRLIGRPDDVEPTIRDGLRLASAGRPRPVGIEIPVDVLHAPVAEAGSSLFDLVDQPEDTVAIDRLAEELASASRPVIYAGWGVHASGAAPALADLAERVGAPVVVSASAPGAIPADDPWALTHASSARAFGEADLVLVVGSRFRTRSAEPELRADTPIAYVNADARDIGAPRRPGTAVIGDVDATLRALIRRLPGLSIRSRWTPDEAAEIRSETAKRFEVLAPQRSWLDAIRAAMPRESVFVSEMTQLGYAAPDLYPVYRERGFISPGYQGTLGYGFATALGAKVGVGDVPVVSVNGDGGFGWTLQELATAAKYGIGLLTIVVRDDRYGNVHRIQRDLYDGRHLGTDLHNPNFPALAESFGVRGEQALSPDALSSLLQEGVSSGDPMLIEVPVGEFPDPWGLIA